MAESVTDADYIEYKDIPNFPLSTVEGHEGKLVIGLVGRVAVMLMQGRFHGYEGYPLRKVHGFGSYQYNTVSPRLVLRVAY